ncbi:ATP-binding protein [Qipengyuania sp.]|uniref:ATP-binding protein n=1 Tax=Qipengyuania sp. TaxID=2004515 RepID=UPI003AF904EC
MRLGPRSLLGQVMLALAAALLIAQAISAGMLYRAANERREFAFMNAAAFQLLFGSRSDDQRRRRDRPPPRHRLRDGESGLRLPRSFRYTETAAFPLPADAPRDERREAVLETLLEARGMTVESLAITVRPLAREPGIARTIRNTGALRGSRQGLPRDLMVVALKQQGSDVWQVVRLPVPPPDRAVVRTLVLQTVILFAVLVGLLYFVLRRITRPLDALAERTRRFAGAGSAEPPLPASGPDDVRKLIEAHNAMQARIVSMLDEKDVMLGAIGHDLKTPLAALRVRIESVEDDAARTRMAASIEDITKTLDEILALARVGRNDTPAEMTELGALAASVVEEFEDMGRPVTLAMQGRVAAPVHLTWLKRGLRNLITNALRYAGTARVEVLRADGVAILRVDDDGPGIPEDRIQAMLEPFTRGEASRNRATGGSGLGLTLARAVAEQHGGTLVLANRPEGGLRAEFRIPL